MYTTTKGNTVYHNFSSIHDVVNYIHSVEENNYTKECRPPRSEKTSDKFIRDCKTDSYAHAEDLLLHGWEYGTNQLKSKIGINKCATEHIQKPVYNVQGYQCSVPRYLQGLPDNMICSKRVAKQNKVITIYKSCCYSYKVSSDKILEESAKVLRLVQRLEQDGYRVNLYIIAGMESTFTHDYSVTTIKIKESCQRLNLKQVAFPLVNPSMLRRIMLKLIERYKECNEIGYSCYGGVVYDKKVLFTDKNKGQYFIPNIVSEQEITNLDKYML